RGMQWADGCTPGSPPPWSPRTPGDPERSAPARVCFGIVPDESMTPPRVCFVGLGNLPVLAPEYADRPAGGAQLQQVLLAKALARRGWPVSMIVADWGQPDGATWHDVHTIRAYRPDEGMPVVRFLHPRWTKLQRA